MLMSGCAIGPGCIRSFLLDFVVLVRFCNGAIGSSKSSKERVCTDEELALDSTLGQF